MLAGFFKGLFYLYVVLALAPLAMITVAFAVGMATGADPWRWPFGNAAVIAPMGATGDGSETSHVTFRTQPLALPKTEANVELYAIGVGNTKTSAPSTREEIQESMLADGQTYYVVDPSVSRPGLYGAFTNFLVWDKRTGSVRKVFDRRVAARALVSIDTATDKSLAILAADTDTNRDGRIGPTDIQSLYIYHLRDGTLHTVRNLPGSPIAVEEASEPGYLLVRVVLDKNNDGAAVASALPYVAIADEPRALYRVDLKTFEAAPLVPDAMVGELQRELDATAAAPKKP